MPGPYPHWSSPHYDRRSATVPLREADHSGSRIYDTPICCHRGLKLFPLGRFMLLFTLEPHRYSWSQTWLCIVDPYIISQRIVYKYIMMCRYRFRVFTVIFMTHRGYRVFGYLYRLTIVGYLTAMLFWVIFTAMLLLVICTLMLILFGSYFSTFQHLSACLFYVVSSYSVILFSYFRDIVDLPPVLDLS